MDQQKVDMYLTSNSKYFESHHLNAIREALLQADDSKFMNIQAANLKDPTLMLIASLLAGSLGLDRFLVGDIGLGVGKLLTCGGLGIWAIVDWFLIMGRAKQVNYNAIQQALL